MRSSINRMKKYSAKLDGSISQLRLQRYGNVQKANFKGAIQKQVEIEQQVKAYLSTHGISTMFTNYYILFAKNMLNPNPVECDIEFNKWVVRNLSWYHLRNIGRMIFNRRLNLYDMGRDPSTVVYLPFSEGSGTTTFDKSGNGINGTLNLPTWEEGLLGNGLYFDGVDDKVTTADSDKLDIGVVSLIAWVNPLPKDSEEYNDIISRRVGLSQVDYGIIVAQKSTGWKAGWVLYDGTNRYGFESTYRDYTGWSMIAFTYDGTTGLLYVDGNLVSTVGPFGAIVNSDVGLSIGKSTATYYKGHIDEVRIFNRVLTPAEILNIYNAEKPFYD